MNSRLGTWRTCRMVVRLPNKHKTIRESILKNRLSQFKWGRKREQIPSPDRSNWTQWQTKGQSLTLAKTKRLKNTKSSPSRTQSLKHLNKSTNQIKTPKMLCNEWTNKSSNKKLSKFNRINVQLGVILRNQRLRWSKRKFHHFRLPTECVCKKNKKPTWIMCNLQSRKS